LDVWGRQEFMKLLEDKGVELDLHESEHATVHLN
jgi:hypothetical protein